jgi:hypothetical protein
MAINFPDSPINGQEITEGNVTYVYNATKGYWESSEGSSSGASTTVYADMAALIAKTGMSNGDQAFVTGNNNLYIYSGSGWYKVATVQNDAPSAITGVNGTYELAIDGTATTITAVSTDPEGFPLTWSYSTSGLGSIATVSHSDGVFTITPSTTEADAGTFSLTINATDGVNGAVSTSTNLTLEFIVTVANSNYTTLLATVVDTSDNNNITDSSTNNHSITVTGDAHAGTFSPYRSGGYSTYFDGSGDYLTTTGTAIGTGDFTLEAWIYTASFSNYRTIFTNRGSSNSTSNFVLGVDSAAQVYLYSNNFLITSSSTLSANTWHHVALVRNGTGSGSTVLYIDGSSVGSADVSNNFSDTAYDIGGDTVDSYHWNGYISDLRVNIGTAIYTSAFTPPTKRLTAITNTSLLTCHLPYISDGSTNDHSITINGDPETKPFSPYDYNEYSATDNGGSVYFDGSGDYISIPHASLPAPSTDSFCVEFWAMWTQPHTASTVQVSKFTTSNHGYELVYSQASSGYIFQGGDNHSMRIVSSYVPEINVWHHIAGVRDGSNARLYINGKLRGTDTSAGASFVNPAVDLTVGARPGGTLPHTGYISDVRYVHGNPVYTAEFTPPTAPLSTITNTEVHIKGTDASIIDKSQSSNLKLVGNTTGSTTQVKFAGSKSMYFDGSGDYIDTNTNLHGNFGIGDYTVEAWAYLDEAIGATRVIFGSGINDSTDEFTLALLSSGHIYFDWNGPFDYIQSSSTFTAYTWHHIAITRSGTQLDVWLDGVSVASSSSHSFNYTGTSTFKVGMARVGSFYWNGYIQDVRLTKGLARYTTNFTPPTAPLKG